LAGCLCCSLTVGIDAIAGTDRFSSASPVDEGLQFTAGFNWCVAISESFPRCQQAWKSSAMHSHYENVAEVV
jgi:TctA family transporter